MNRTYKVEGIVIKRSNFGEADRIITVFTQRKGKIRIKAPGVRRIKSKRAPHIELFNYSRLYLHIGQHIDIVTEAQVLESYDILRKDLRRVSVAYYIAELIENLCPELSVHTDVFEDTRFALAKLNNSTFLSFKQLIDEYSVHILTKLGFLAPGKVYFGDELRAYIEKVSEKKLKTYDLLT